MNSVLFIYLKASISTHVSMESSWLIVFAPMIYSWSNWLCSAVFVVKKLLHFSCSMPFKATSYALTTFSIGISISQHTLVFALQDLYRSSVGCFSCWYFFCNKVFIRSPKIMRLRQVLINVHALQWRHFGPKNQKIWAPLKESFKN